MRAHCASVNIAVLDIYRQSTLSTASPLRHALDVVWSFLSSEAYWGRWRTREDVARQVRSAWRVVGVYQGRKMVGFARAVSDGVALAYLADVFVLRQHRDRGLGRRMITEMIEDGPGAAFRWLLHTADAHRLYAQFGLTVPDPTLLERPAARAAVLPVPPPQAPTISSEGRTRVRRGTVQDLAGVAAVHLATRRSAYADLLPNEVLAAMSRVSVQSWWEQRLRTVPRPHQLLVASSEGQDAKIFGFAHVGLGDDPGEHGALGQVHALHVHPSVQGDGLGARLLSEACSVLQDLGFGHVRLWVLEGNERAQRFYRQHEWRLAEGLRKTEFVDGAPVSELAYDKDLADN
jgi:ribosomal protein S18 acetylase RimI-like enzyme